MAMRAFWQLLKQNKSFVWIAAGLMVGSSVIGFVMHDEVQPIVKEMLKQLQDVVENIAADHTFTNIFWTIFLNNTKAAFIMLASGLLFGLYPAIALLSNGFMLGFIISDAALRYGESPLRLFVTQIMPHGMFELPAIIIAGGFGIKFGWLAIGWIRSLWNPGLRTAVSRDTRTTVRRLPLLCIGVVALLLVAATIESALIAMASVSP